MLYFGAALMTPADLEFLRIAIKSLYSRKKHPMKGIEIGPWLGRSTLNILAPDLRIGEAHPIISIVMELTAQSFSSEQELINALIMRSGRLADSYSRDELLSLIFRELTHRIHPKHQYFEKLWCVDTWGGIESEKNQFFQESLNGKAKEIFLSNIAKAGFRDAVEALHGDSSILSSVSEIMDFVFVDADHEYESLAKDLFAVRHTLSPGKTFLCGHDYAQTERWPGVKMAVDNFVKHFIVDGNIWVARPEGIEFLLSAPDYQYCAEMVSNQHKILNRRYSSPEYCKKFGLEMK